MILLSAIICLQVETPDHILAMFNPDPLGVLVRAGVTLVGYDFEPEPEI